MENNLFHAHFKLQINFSQSIFSAGKSEIDESSSPTFFSHHKIEEKSDGRKDQQKTTVKNDVTSLKVCKTCFCHFNFHSTRAEAAED